MISLQSKHVRFRFGSNGYGNNKNEGRDNYRNHRGQGGGGFNNYNQRQQGGGGFNKHQNNNNGKTISHSGFMYSTFTNIGIDSFLFC